ncbi:MAG: carboxypeptidase regulatory-like domain-containing protein [Actinomycetia bacterium]|nr:carboxypeptidase regulatory-like domain-containing protein [Actinomycetes bacterium]
MKKWNLIIDVALCHDCNNCFLADKDEFVGNDFPPYSLAQPWSGHRWMNIEGKEKGQYPIVQVAYLPIPCMHCDDAPCLTADGAVYKRADGLVIIDPEKAKGRDDIVDTCPYGAIYWNEEARVPQKCTGCVHLLEDGWKETRCSQVCPTGALTFVLADDAEMAERVAAEGLEAFRPELGTKPRVLYKNLHRWTKVFVAGSAAFADTDECAEGAEVTVNKAGIPVAEGRVNNYGEFAVEKLEPGETYDVVIEAAGYRPHSATVTLDQSVTMDLVLLQKAEEHSLA